MVILGPVAVMYHPIPAQTPRSPQHSLLSCHSHPPCLVPPPYNRWCSRAGKVSHYLFAMGRGKSLALNKLQFLMKKHHSHGAGAVTITHSGNCYRLCQKGPRQELQGWRLGALTVCYWPMMKWHRPPGPGKGSPTPQHPPIGTQVPPKSEGEMQVYLYKYKV